MRLFFSILSLAYVFVIFFFAGSSVADHLLLFNPYSLLHIPLYGILTVLLTFSFFNYKAAVSKSRLLIPGLMGFVVALGDEIYQTYLPVR